MPHKWSLADPFLYDLTVQFHRDKSGNAAVPDEVTSYFGIRSVELGIVKGQLRPMLNGKFEFMYGPLDQGYWPDGVYTAPTDAALRFDLEVTKKLGFNLVRKHAKLEPQRWYYWCDKMGLMVWQDMPSMWYPEDSPNETRAEFEREWQIIIEQHSNSPAIVGWVPFNENWGAYDVPRITDWTKQFDPHPARQRQHRLQQCTRLSKSRPRRSEERGDFGDSAHLHRPRPTPNAGAKLQPG